MYSNIMEIKFPNKSDNERFARTVAAAFVLELDPTVDQISEIKTAVSEAVTNAIIHGYDEKDGIVTMSGSIEDDTVTFSVSDDGEYRIFQERENRFSQVNPKWNAAEWVLR